MSQPEREELLSALLSAPVPRQVPDKVRRAAQRQAASFVVAIIAGFFFFFIPSGIVSGTFLWSFAPDFFLNELASRVPGRVAAVTKINYKAGRSRQTVYAYDFVFLPAGTSVVEVPKGTHPTLTGVCYTTDKIWSPGAPVEIEYLGTFPTVARIAGSRTTRSSFSFIDPLGPLSGLLLVANALFLRRRALWLLVHGARGQARVQSIAKSGGTNNRQTDYAISLRPIGFSDGAPWTLRPTDRNLVGFLQSRLDSGQPVYMLYDPAKPTRAIFPESLLLE